MIVHTAKKTYISISIAWDAFIFLTMQVKNHRVTWEKQYYICLLKTQSLSWMTSVLERKRKYLHQKENISYGGIGVISRWLSDLGFKPSGDEMIAFSNSFRAWKSQIVPWHHLTRNYTKCYFADESYLQ